MEFDRTPPGAADPGMYGCDREVFERVWRRVMPEDQYGSPVELFGEDRAQSRLYDTEGGGAGPLAPGAAHRAPRAANGAPGLPAPTARAAGVPLPLRRPRGPVPGRELVHLRGPASGIHRR